MIRRAKITDVMEITKLGEVLTGRYKTNLDRNCSYFYVYENDGIQGFIYYLILHERAELVDFIVAVDKRRRGIGTELLKKMKKHCKTKGVKSITLEVNVNNSSAIAFYEKNDFKVISTRKDYYGQGKDGFLMEYTYE